MAWKIKSKTKTLKKHGQPPEPRYWSAEFGWTTKESADTFSDEEKGSANKPINSVWEETNGG